MVIRRRNNSRYEPLQVRTQSCKGWVARNPLGPPFAYEHFHDSAGRAGASYLDQCDLSVARDKILINLPQVHSDTWMTQMR
jgi:hypothetical protein